MAPDRMAPDQTVYVVDDDPSVRESLRWLIESVGQAVVTYESAGAFLQDLDRLRPGCLLLDVRLKDMSGLEVQEVLAARRVCLPVIFITGYGDVHMAVQAMKRGAADFITKPLNDQQLLEAIQRALSQEREALQRSARRERVQRRLAALSPRERQVLERVVAGKMNKVIAAELNISSKTVEAHRARVMEKMQARNLAELVRLTLIAEQGT